MLAQTNARLVKVERTGGDGDEPGDGGWSEDYDRPASDAEGDADAGGADLWAGNVAAYYVERRERTTGEGGRNLILRRWISVDSKHPPIEFEEEDTITWTYKGKQGTGKVETIEQRELPGVPGSVRLTLVAA